ncbi:hypothetical protein B0H14DRAFT_2594466 [Mycena olivaceomarginata]|nr:hypothetical protein B0H14DRAFT_2594466 [Mycena olivaceomarginata]
MSPARAQDTPATDAPARLSTTHTHTALLVQGCTGAHASIKMQRLLPTEEDLAAEAHKIDLEEEDSLTLADQIDALINEAVQDFPDEDDIDSAAKYAAEIRIKPAKGIFVSTRAALTYWYRTVRPNESVTMGSQHALDMTCTICMITVSNRMQVQHKCDGELSAMFQTAYLFAWLLLLRFEEVENISRCSFRLASLRRQEWDMPGLYTPTILTPRSVRFALLSDLRLYTEKPLL